MPFDGLIATHPTLETLSDVLRDRSRWPAGFTWNYADCSHCAMGLVAEIWPGSVSYPCAVQVARVFGMSFGSVVDIFHHLGTSAGKPVGEVMPEDVANAIDRHLAMEAF